MLVGELRGTFPIAAGAGLKQCCASINFSTYQTGPGIRVFSSSCPHAWHVRYLVLFCGWSEFSTLIVNFQRQEERVLMMKPCKILLMNTL